MQRGGGIPDPDAPSDAESTRFWCTTGSKFTDREKLEMTMETTAAVKTTAEQVGGLMGCQLDQASQLALMDGKSGTPESTSTSAGPSLQELVNVMTGATTTSAKAKGKSKAKAKAKAAVAVQNAKTPGEQRDAMRRLI